MGKQGFGIVWLIVCMAAIAICVGAYFFFRSSTENTNSQKNVVNQETSTTLQPETKETKTKETAPGTTVKSGDSQFGSILFDGKGQAIYIWEVEDTKKAECYGDCAIAWPPVLTNGEPVASGDVKSELLGTTKRTDGTTQVTYNGHPLYYYAHEKPGEVKCHNISTHGGLWWVIQSNGKRAK